MRIDLQGDLNRQAILALLVVVGLVFVLGVLAGGARASDSVMWANPHDDEDVVFAWTWTVGGASVGNFIMRSLADLNNDGDLLDANEDVQEFSVSGGCVGNAASAHLACAVGTAGASRNNVIFKNGSSLHVPGRNLSLSVTLLNAVGQQVDIFVSGIRVLPASPGPLSELYREADSIRSRMNATNCVQNHCTDFLAGLLNQSYANVSQNLSYINQTGVFCLNCTAGNDTLNHTALRASFAQDCHGTGADFCLNGHVPNEALESAGEAGLGVLVVAGVLFGTAGLLWLASRGGYWPAVAGVGLLAVLAVLLTNVAVPDGPTWTALVLAPIAGFLALAATYYWNLRAREVTA